MDDLPVVRSFGWTSTGRGQRLATCLALVVAALASAGLVAPAGASAAASCEEPPVGHVDIHGTQGEGTINLNNRLNAEAVGGTFSCGLLNVVNLQYEIPSSDLVYNPFTLKLFGFLPLEGGLTAAGTTTGQLVPVTRVVNEFEEETLGYNTSSTTPVTLTTGFLGLARCDIGPLTVGLTTGRSGSLEGQYLAGSLLFGMSGTVVGNEFSVPKIEPSRTCPFFVAGLGNLILGLPLAPGASSVTFKEFLEAG